MTAHPMTHRARLLAEESGESWLILPLCDTVDALHTEVLALREQLDAALCDMADEVAA